MCRDALSRSVDSEPKFAIYCLVFFCRKILKDVHLRRSLSILDHLLSTQMHITHSHADKKSFKFSCWFHCCAKSLSALSMTSRPNLWATLWETSGRRHPNIKQTTIQTLKATATANMTEGIRTRRHHTHPTDRRTPTKRRYTYTESSMPI